MLQILPNFSHCWEVFIHLVEGCYLGLWESRWCLRNEEISLYVSL